MATYATNLSVFDLADDSGTLVFTNIGSIVTATIFIIAFGFAGTFALLSLAIGKKNINRGFRGRRRR